MKTNSSTSRVLKLSGAKPKAVSPPTPLLPPIVLTRRQTGAVVRLLGELQSLIESSIEAQVLKGETEPREEWLKPIIAEQRRQWSEAEGIVQFLEVLLDAQRGLASSEKEGVSGKERSSVPDDSSKKRPRSKS